MGPYILRRCLPFITTWYICIYLPCWWGCVWCSWHQCVIRGKWRQFVVWFLSVGSSFCHPGNRMETFPPTHCWEKKNVENVKYLCYYTPALLQCSGEWQDSIEKCHTLWNEYRVWLKFSSFEISIIASWECKHWRSLLVPAKCNVINRWIPPSQLGTLWWCSQLLGLPAYLIASLTNLQPK